MDDKRKILDKIKKCLALSASSNEHEAAAALRQARKLMETHAISHCELWASRAREQRARAGKKNPASWEVLLADRIGKALGCRPIFVPGDGSGEWAFIGTGTAPEVAAYALVVMLRQARRARATYIRECLSAYLRHIKTRRADVFSLAWVNGATATIGAFVGTDDQRRAIDAYVETFYPSTTTTHCKKNGRQNWKDVCAGLSAGGKSRLHRAACAPQPAAALE